MHVLQAVAKVARCAGDTDNAMERLRKQIAENMNERFTHHG